MPLPDTFNNRYRVTFFERANPANRLTAWLGGDPVTPSGGGGGYNVIGLPMRSPVSVWQGRGSLLVMDVPIFVWHDDNSGDATINEIMRVERLWRPVSDTIAPPVIKVTAPGSAVPHQRLPWWISDFTWGNAIGDDDGNRTVQLLTVQVTEYRADEQLQTVRSKTDGVASVTGDFYTVKRGETLQAIAARYTLPGGWRQLAQAQNPPIRDPRSLSVGQRLLIPDPVANGLMPGP